MQMKVQIPWTEKYRPKNFAEIVGQDLQVKKVENYLQNFTPKAKRGVKKAILLHGPPGVGKTTIAHVAALVSDAEIFELNASDFRSSQKLETTLKPASEQQSLLKTKKIILVDEIDGISGFEDRGGLQELMRLIDSTSWPLILTANDVWNKKFNALRKKCEVVQLKEVSYTTVKNVLIEILRKEGLFINHDILTSIAVKARGDMRAAVNDLQSIAEAQKRGEEVSADMLTERNKEKDIFNALKQVFKLRPSTETLGIYDDVNMPLDQILLWVEENIPKEYKDPKELLQAYEYVAKADIFKGRIYKQQYWRFLAYENIFLSYGVAAAKNPNTSRQGFTSYTRPTRILKIWMHNQRTIKKKSIAAKYAQYVHIGVKRALHEFPVIKPILQKPHVQKELKLSEEEIAYLAE